MLFETKTTAKSSVTKKDWLEYYVNFVVVMEYDQEVGMALVNDTISYTH